MAMTMNEMELLNNMIQKTDSILIIFFILMMMACILVLIPFYKIISKNKADKEETEAARLDKYMQRESELLEVITKNTEVISELKALFEATIHNFSASNDKLNERFTAVDDKVDKVVTQVNVLDTKVDQLRKKDLEK